MAYNPNNPNGSATSANSAPVVIASDQATVPVSLASVPAHAVTNAGTFATQATLQAGNNNVGDVDVASIAAGDNNIGNVDVVTINSVAPAFGTGVRGATVQRVTIATDDSVPVTIASVPSHAVTNAGTFATQESQILADNAGFTDGTTKVFASGYIYDEVAGTALTENDVAAARINVNRGLVNVLEDGATRGRYATVTASNALKVDASGVAVPITDNSGSLTVDAPVGTPAFVRLSDGAAAISTLPVSLATVPSHAVTNAGTFVTQENGSALTALQLMDDTVFADDAAFTVAVSKVNAVGFLADESSTDSVDEGDVGIPRMTLDRKQVVTPLPHTGNGLLAHKTDALVATAVAVKASAGNLYGYHIFNPNAADMYVHFYNIASGSTTVGTSARTISLLVPGGGVLDGVFPLPVSFATAITVAATTTLTGSTAPGTGLVTNIFYF